jgi:hypothetical protein
MVGEENVGARVGPVASYLNGKATAALTFPALSVHVPLIDPVEVLGPL